MSSYTRAEWAEAFLRKLGNPGPHPYLIKYVVAWTQIESSKPEHYAWHNLLNTTEKAFGFDLLPLWNEVGVKQYPTFEDGVAANAAALIGGPEHFYPTLLNAFRLNQGQDLIDVTPEIAHEMTTWSGGANYAEEIARIAASPKEVRLAEAFGGRRAGEAS